MSESIKKILLPIITGVGLLIAVLIIVSFAFYSNQNSDKSEIAQQHTEPLTEPTEVTPEDKIKNAINDTFSVSQTDKGLNKVEEVRISKTEDGGYIVEVHINSDSYQGLPLLETESSQIYRSLYSNDLSVNKATVNAYHEFSDEYGNLKNEKVLTTHLDKETASKINFSADDINLNINIIPGLWVKSFENHKNGY